MKKYILGIESTAHTFGIAIVRKGKILCNLKDSYTTSSGGMIPVESAKHHEQVKEILYKEALEKSGIKEKEIKAVAFSQAPGLAPCLLVGMRFAKEIAKRLSVPIIPVNHCISHLEIGNITKAKNPVLLYCSGANTQIISYSSGKYRIFGETLDLGIGNFIDTFARYMNIGFPGGPVIARLAEEYRKQEKKEYVELPYSIKGMDVAFSGMLTNLKQKIESRKYSKEQLAYSMEETAFAMLVEAAERAMAHLNKKELLLGGGVACNKRLQEMCSIMCKERGAELFVPENFLLVDNAGMIAFTGEIMLNSGIKEKDINKIDILPRQRTDEINVLWR
jgi:glycoprotease/Kae1 family metallohydrolase